MLGSSGQEDTRARVNRPPIIAKKEWKNYQQVQQQQHMHGMKDLPWEGVNASGNSWFEPGSALKSENKTLLIIPQFIFSEHSESGIGTGFPIAALLPKLKVGCQRVSEPVSRLFCINQLLKTTAI